MVRLVAQARASHGVSTTPVPAGQLRVIGEGRPLEPEVRRTMESFFQADFSGVRVHVGPAARVMGALAFTSGEELHFAPGLYDPASREGAALLGHELTHVVQQREGRVSNPYGHGVAIVQDPELEAEADRMGQRVAEEVWSAWSFRHIPAVQGKPERAWPSQRSRTVLLATDVKAAPVEVKQAPAAAAPAAAVEYTPVVNKRKVKKKAIAFDEKQHQKAKKIPRTWCIGTAGGQSVEVVSSDMGAEARKLLQTWLPDLYNHLLVTDNEPNRTSFVCAEVNAVVQLINLVLAAKKVPDKASIRISHSWDAQTKGWKGPCRNCRTWLTATAGTMAWTVGTTVYNVTAYSISI
jgi:hypothetical protein